MLFLHLFRYRLRTLLREKACVGWNIAFPIVLATAFFFGFGNMIRHDPESFQVVPAALVEESGSDGAFSDMVRTLSKSGKNQLFDLTEVSDEAEAEKLLKAGKVDGIFLAGEKPSLTVAENGMNQMILSEFLEEYDNYAGTMETIIRTNPSEMQNAAEMLSEKISFIEEKDFHTDKTVSPYLQYFYALIAMTCLYGSWISTSIIENISANQSCRGARYECAPVPKILSVLSGALAGLVFVFGAVTLLMLYIHFVLGISLGDQVLPMCLAGLLGSLIGVAGGMMLGVLTGKNTVLKTAVPLAFAMVCSFLGGLMYGQMKQIIEAYVPVINRINPAALISDCYYALNTYGVGKRYYTDCLYMLVISGVFAVTAAVLLRRRNYASI